MIRPARPSLAEVPLADLPFAKDYPLGDHQLQAGDHKLTLEMVGVNEKARKGRLLIGVDCITTERIP